MTAPIAGGGDLPGDDDNRGTNPAAPSGGHLFSLRAKVFDADDLRRAHTRIAHEIVERNHGATDVVLIGLYTLGVAVAHRLAEAIERFAGVAVPAGGEDAATAGVIELVKYSAPGGPGIGRRFALSVAFVEVPRPIPPKSPARRARASVPLLSGARTLPRLSFETAAKRLTADTMSFT